jgi:trans-aconitate methyltransferase
MNDADLELIDSDPTDPFDFSIDHYKEQLVAGYSKMTPHGGLCVHMPDYSKIKQHSSSKH